jgi:hypothetical protein
MCKRGKARLWARGWSTGLGGSHLAPPRLEKWERCRVRKGDSPHAVPVPFSEATCPVDTLFEPVRMAKGLDFQDVQVREQAEKFKAEK